VAYLPLAHDYIGAPLQLPFDETLAVLMIGLALIKQ
jgi:hypothetical protein